MPYTRIAPEEHPQGSKLAHLSALNNITTVCYIEYRVPGIVLHPG